VEIVRPLISIFQQIFVLFMETNLGKILFGIFIGIIFERLFIKTRAWMRGYSSKRNSIKFDEKIIPRLNEKFKDKAHIYGLVAKDPLVDEGGRYDLSSVEEKTISDNREKLRCKGNFNDMHAIVVGETSWYTDPVVLQTKSLEYAAVMALRDSARSAGKPLPQVLTANVLVICSEEKKIIIHKRSKGSATNPDTLQVFGGGYMPKPPEDDRRGCGERKEHDGKALWKTAERELREESDINLVISEKAVRLLSMDRTSGTIQLTYIGCDIKKHVIDRAREESKNNKNPHSWEGELKEIYFDKLDEILSGEAFSPTGKIFILVWLALGAPGYGGKFRVRSNGGKYKNCSAKKLFEKHMQA